MTDSLVSFQGAKSFGKNEERTVGHGHEARDHPGQWGKGLELERELQGWPGPLVELEPPPGWTDSVVFRPVMLRHAFR